MSDIEGVKILEGKGMQTLADLLSVAKAFRDWVDSVPQETTLPAMPGVDRDWADTVIEEAELEVERDSSGQNDPMPYSKVVFLHRNLLWDHCERERQVLRDELIRAIDAILESSGKEPYDWKNSGEGIENYIERVLDGSAQNAALKRWVKLEEIGDYYRRIYNRIFK